MRHWNLSPRIRMVLGTWARQWCVKKEPPWHYTQAMLATLHLGDDQCALSPPSPLSEYPQHQGVAAYLWYASPASLWNSRGWWPCLVCLQIPSAWHSTWYSEYLANVCWKKNEQMLGKVYNLGIVINSKLIPSQFLAVAYGHIKPCIRMIYDA